MAHGNWKMNMDNRLLIGCHGFSSINRRGTTVMMRTVRTILCVLTISGVAAQAGEADAATAAAKKAVDFLSAQQTESGGFGKKKDGGPSPTANIPGVVGLVVKAIASTPDKPREDKNPVLAKAAKLLVSKQQADGSIAIPGFGHENL